jgi:hypothetical protein
MRWHILLIAITAAAVTIAPGIYSGTRNFRWGTDVDLNRTIARMEQFPEQIGSWTQIDELPLDESARNQLQPRGVVNRIYSDGKHYASVFILLGPAGPTAVHTPDICFNVQAYTALGPRSKIALAGEQNRGRKSELWQVDFESKGIEANSLRSWYGWTVDGTWHASENPRYEFSVDRHLFKVQVAVTYPTNEAMLADTTGIEFVKALENTIHSTLFTRSSNNSRLRDQE